LTAATESRILPKWLDRSPILVIAAGAILFLLSYPIAHLAVASNYTQNFEHVELDVVIYAFYVMIIGGLWGIAKSLLFGALHEFFTQKNE